MRAFLGLIITAALLLPVTQPAQACGDKFLLVGRGVTFHRAYAAVYPASIVIYAQPQRKAAKAIRDPRLQAELKLAGHRVALVENDEALARALEDGSVDLVLTDLADADQTARRTEISPGKPAVLPVMDERTSQEARDVEARYQCRLKSSDRADRYLTTIDDKMKARADQR